jgi:hypothetical protein
MNLPPTSQACKLLHFSCGGFDLVHYPITRLNESICAVAVRVALIMLVIDLVIHVIAWLSGNNH